MLIPYTTICPECWKEPSKADADAQERLSLDTETQKYVCAAGHSFDSLPGATEGAEFVAPPELPAEVAALAKETAEIIDRATGTQALSPTPAESETRTEIADRRDAVWDAARLADKEYDGASADSLLLTRAEYIGRRVMDVLYADVRAVSVPRADAIAEASPFTVEMVASPVNAKMDADMVRTQGRWLLTEGQSHKLENGDMLVCIRIPEVHASVLQACTDEHPAKITFGEYVQRAINFALDQDWLRNAGN